MHDQHRKRMRERYLKCGFDGFATHELLEFLLFYSIPRCDTNPIAHELMEHFGSLESMLEASVEELCEVQGLGPSSAMLLKLIPELMRRYAEERVVPTQRYDAVSKIAQYFVNRFIGVDHECLYMMLLNNRMNLIDCVLVSEGSVNCSAVPVRLMTEKALSKKAAAVVLAHNHPHGVAIPSGNDLDVTDMLNNTFHLIGIPLLEHLVIAEDRFMPIMKQHCGKFRCASVEGQIESCLYSSFYDVDEATWKAPPLFPRRHRDEAPNEEKGTTEDTTT